MRQPMELMYEPVRYARFDIPDVLTAPSPSPITLTFPLREFNGPIRELCFFLRRKDVWRFSDWTNYGAKREDELNPNYAWWLAQSPLLVSAQLMVGNAVWRDEAEEWWGIEYGLQHRGGVRLDSGWVYGMVLGEGAGWEAENLQPAGTVNASRADMKLVLTMQSPTGGTNVGWDVHVFGVGLNWMRFVKGLAVPMFKD
jgi:hypothetical protein